MNDLISTLTLLTVGILGIIAGNILGMLITKYIVIPIHDFIFKV